MMKRMKLVIPLCFLTCALSAQVATENYVRTRQMLNEASTSYVDNISYYDGLGRPYQNVQKAVKAGTQTGSILATLQEYDGMGRQSNTWLPVVTSSDYVAASTFKSSAPGNYGNDSRPYSQVVYEASPLNRITAEYGPGVAWSTHPANRAYMSNTTVSPLNCINYSVSSSGVLTNGGNYAIGQLYVTKTTDEDGNATYTFTDKLGRTVLVRQMSGNEAHDTYNVYDEKSNLCFVLQPMYQTSANLDQYAFQYKYDGLNRCIWKKLPGAQYVEYVYDVADRLTFSQDGNQRANGSKWTYYLYDGFNRLTQQGECTGKNAATNQVVHVQNFYDSYSAFRTIAGNNANFPDDASGNSKGYLTGSVVTVLGSTTKLYTAHYYDIKGRVTKSVQSNLLAGYETTSTVYTFTGNPLTITHTHTASGKTTRTEVYSYTYDHADRVSKVEHTLGGVKVTLADYAYDNLGRRSSISPHGSAANKLTYAYNLRGWLTGITGTNFTQNLYYTDGTNATKCYNGNISSMTWKGSDGTTRGYKLNYDGLSRLTSAAYGETTSINTNLDRFTEKITSYDKNGNIQNLQRYGQTGASTYGLIDNLTCTLAGNQLNRVDDAVTVSAYNNGFEFKDAVKQAGEYSYDVNGNLSKDLNKGITGIQYNVLNLPSVVMFSGGSSTITYTYAADGTKLRTVHKIDGVTTTMDYCGNVIYENGTAKLLLTEEGYVSLGDNKYHYYLKDHQGNNRVVINQAGAVEEANHYYPFGGVFANSSNVQPYKYNGKELNTKKGLNWYDYGARHYDAALGRFTTLDPLAEKYSSMSPYLYCGGNPVNRIDPDGRDWYQNNETKYYTWYKGNEPREGYTHIGSKGSVLGDFEPIIDGLLTGPKGYNTKSLYSEGFTFDIAPNDKGGLLASKERGWDFLDEFANGVGPEFSVLLSDHPYTEAMKTDEFVLDWQRKIADGDTNTPGQVTNAGRNWTPLNVFGTTSMAKQFIGSYRYDAFTSSDGKMLNNVISDSNSRTSLFYHLPFTNKSRSQTRAFSNTYQFYIWKSPK